MNHRRLVAASQRWFRLLLRMYPPDFRNEMGDFLIETYVDRLHDAMNHFGLAGFAGVWFIAFRDSLRNGLGERIHPAVSWRRNGDWGRDIQLVRRRLMRKPIFLAVTIATLTIGLGTFAVVYTAIDKILLEPLPFSSPEHLYMIWGKFKRAEHMMVTGPEVVELQRAGGIIESAAGMQFSNATLPVVGDRDAMRLPAVVSTANLFDVLGVHPAIGRGFRLDEEGPNAPNVVVLSDGLWKRLGADPAIIGKTLELSSTRGRFTVIGVMPPGFQFTGSFASIKADLYVPVGVDLSTRNAQDTNYLSVIRSRPGTTVEQVRQAVDAVGRVTGERDFHSSDHTLFPIGLHAELVQDFRPALLALGFAAIFLLVVLTVNLASLLLAHSAEREREFAVSRALGANGAAIVRATLFEGAVLGLIGGAAGTVAGFWGTRLLVALGPLNLPRREAVSLDWSVAFVVIIVSVLLGILAASVPAMWAARVSLASLISGIATRGSASSGRMRRGLIVAQVALSLVLLTAGGLVVRSFERLMASDPGFKAEGVLTFSLGLTNAFFPQDPAAYAFMNRVDEAVRALPGVTAVSATTQLPLSGGGSGAEIQFPGAPGNTGDSEQDKRQVSAIYVRAGYIEAMGIRLIEGRGFDSTSREGVREVLIDSHLAKQFFPNSSALGATLFAAGSQTASTVVGVVDQAHLFDLYIDDDTRQIYRRADDFTGRRPGFYVVRTDQDPRVLFSEVRSVIRQIDPRVSVSDVRTMRDIVADRRSRERISAVLISGLALGALMLLAMGLFGVIAGSVARRRGELAVRLALGATHHRVIRLVVLEGARLVAMGSIIGIPGMYLSGEALQDVLIVPSFDLPTIASVVVGLALVALITCFLAAARVAKIEPAQLLREGL